MKSRRLNIAYIYYKIIHQLCGMFRNNSLLCLFYYCCYKNNTKNNKNIFYSKTHETKIFPPCWKEMKKKINKKSKRIEEGFVCIWKKHNPYDFYCTLLLFLNNRIRRLVLKNIYKVTLLFIFIFLHNRKL